MSQMTLPSGFGFIPRKPGLAERLGGAVQQGVSGIANAFQESAKEKANIRAKEDAKYEQKRKLLEQIFGVKPGDVLSEGERPKSVADQLTPKPESSEEKGDYKGIGEDQLLNLDPSQRAALAMIDPNIEHAIHHAEEIQEKRTAATKKETLPYRKELANKAHAASRSIDNKKHMLELLKRGKIDDPLTVEASKYLPGAIAGKILSPDTQVYKSAIFDEFGVLKTMFPGQIRVKEIELLEDKLATLEKSHEAKARILETGIRKLEADKIYAQAARQVEKKYPNAGALEFEDLVETSARPKLDKLFEEMMKDYDKIFFEFAPAKSSYVDQNGTIYENVAKKDLQALFDEAKSQGLDLTVAK